jgi:hypothetical protein
MDDWGKLIQLLG